AGVHGRRPSHATPHDRRNANHLPGATVPSASRPPARLAVLVSGGGTNLRALLDAIDADPGFGGEVVVVAADRPDAGGLLRARERGIATVVQELSSHPDRASWEAALRRDVE